LFPNNIGLPKDSIKDAIHHPRLQQRIDAIFDYPVLSQPPQIDDIVARMHQDEDGNWSETYELTADAVERLWVPTNRMASFCITAANDHPYDPHHPHYENRSYPSDTLLEWGHTFIIPHATFADPFHCPIIRKHDTLEDLYREWATYQRIACEYGYWLKSAIKTSLIRGFRSLVNFGANFGLSKKEFLNLLEPGVFDEERDRAEGRLKRKLPHDFHDDRQALILHPQYCNAVINGFLKPVDPNRSYPDGSRPHLRCYIPGTVQHPGTEDPDIVFSFHKQPRLF
jgi:hypothetical protein